MGKFGLRGLAQSLARELRLKHSCWAFYNRGIIGNNLENTSSTNKLNPDDIANCCLQFHRQQPVLVLGNRNKTLTEHF